MSGPTASDRKINIAIVGLGFGAEFIPLYQRHPQARLAAICQRNQKKLDQIGDAFKVERRYADYRQIAQRPRYRRGTHQHADSRSRLDEHRGARGRKTRGVHRADGHVGR